MAMKAILVLLVAFLGTMDIGWAQSTGVRIDLVSAQEEELWPLEKQVMDEFRSQLTLRGRADEKGSQVLFIAVEEVATALGERLLLSIYRGMPLPQHAVDFGVENGLYFVPLEDTTGAPPQWSEIRATLSREWLNKFVSLHSRDLFLIEPFELEATVSRYLDDLFKPVEVN